MFKPLIFVFMDDLYIFSLIFTHDNIYYLSTSIFFTI